MEKTKLTIRMPRDVAEKARQYAEKRGMTLTQLVSEYLRQLCAEDDLLSNAPIVQQLLGILPPDASTEDHRKHLEEKHSQQA